MPTLPPAIRLILVDLAGDAGRRRAHTLMVIQGAGPDYVRLHLTGIDAALGATSPGLGGLEELVREAEEAVSTSQPTVAHQHVISKVVLRRFVEDVPPGGRQLIQFALATGKPELMGPNGVGYVEHFVPVDSATMEALWQEVEDALNRTLAAVSAGTWLSDDAYVTTLRNVVALHFVRNPQTRAAHNRAFAAAHQQSVDAWAETPFAAEAFYRTHGLVVAGPEGRRMGAEAAQGRLVTLYEQVDCSA